MRYHIGLDFGTTNSALVLTTETGEVLTVAFDTATGRIHTFRSILFFEDEAEDTAEHRAITTGPFAIQRYLDCAGEGRLIQSVKSFLASRTFTDTTINSRRYTLADLIALIIQDIRQHAEEAHGSLGTQLVVGRPVHFVGEDPEQPSPRAEERMRRALTQAGFSQVSFLQEPIAAAYNYERDIDHDELLMIADFGGGTSDFSILKVGPSFRNMPPRQRSVLAVDGVGVAGDAFDARIVRHAVSPLLGMGTQYRSADKLLPIPVWLYSHLERWHLLSMLKSPKNLRVLEQLCYQAVEPDTITALMHLVLDNRGFELYQAVNQAKVELSQRQYTTLHVSAPPVEADVTITRADFETWIQPELTQIAACVDRTLAQAGTEAVAIDRVFMTGGSSFVPAVRRIFEERFGAQRLVHGDEFISVARGLACAARDAALPTTA